MTLGVFVLWFAWLCFNGCSTMSNIGIQSSISAVCITNSVLAPCAGGITACILAPGGDSHDHTFIHSDFVIEQGPHLFLLCLSAGGGTAAARFLILPLLLRCSSSRHLRLLAPAVKTLCSGSCEARSLFFDLLC